MTLCSKEGTEVFSSVVPKLCFLVIGHATDACVGLKIFYTPVSVFVFPT
jgi:hypothetical protein